jgi:hypothetical protein
MIIQSRPEAMQDRSAAVNQFPQAKGMREPVPQFRGAELLPVCAFWDERDFP